MCECIIIIQNLHVHVRSEESSGTRGTAKIPFTFTFTHDAPVLVEYGMPFSKDIASAASSASYPAAILMVFCKACPVSERFLRSVAAVYHQQTGEPAP